MTRSTFYKTTAQLSLKLAIYLLPFLLAATASGQSFVSEAAAAPRAQTSLTIVFPLPDDLVLGSSVAIPLQATGGTPPYRWSFLPGKIPPGLNLDSGGLLSGTPTTLGLFPFDIAVYDSGGLYYPIGAGIHVLGTLSFTVFGGNAPLPQNLFWLDFFGASTYTVNSSAAWLSVSPRSGTTSTGQVQTTLMINPAGLAPGTYTGLVHMGNNLNSFVTSVTVTLVVQSQLVTWPSALSFTMRQGDPTSVASKNLNVFANSPGTVFSANVTPAKTGGWYSVPGGGSAPQALPVVADASRLSPGTYSATVVISSQAAGNTVSVPLSLVVLPAVPPKLSVSPATQTLTAVRIGGAVTGAVTVMNAGGGTLHFTATAISDQGNWLVLTTPSAATASSSAPAIVGFTVDPSNLDAALHTGQIRITDTDSGDQSTAYVMVAASPSGLSMQLSRTGIGFLASPSAPLPQAQVFSVSSHGLGTLRWTAQAQVLSPAGSNWLSVSPAAGTAPSSPGAAVSVSVNPTGLPPGQYYGSISVSSPNAVNSPQSLTVVLNVGSSAVQLPVGGALISAFVGGSARFTQPLTVFNPSSAPLSYSVAATVPASGPALSISPAVGNLQPGSNSLVLQSDFPGASSARIADTIGFSFGDSSFGSLQTLLIAKSDSGPQANCVNGAPQVLLGLFLDPFAGSAVQNGSPQLLRAQLVDDCGNFASSSAGGVAQIVFSDGEPPVSLQDAGNGIWEGSWTPTSPSGTITLQLVGSSKSGSAALRTLSVPAIDVSVQPAPALAPAQVIGIVNAAGAGQVVPSVLAPSSYVAIYGQGLAAAGAPAATTVPLPLTMNSTQVLLGEQPLPLSFVGPSQINAVVPAKLNGNATYPLVVVRGTSRSEPVPITVVAQQPAVYTVDTSGSGAGVIEISGTTLLAGPQSSNSRPVQSGSEYLTIFCTGLGAVVGPNGEPPPPDGAAAPSNLLYQTVAKASVTIGGVNVPVLFSGLTPTLVSLYQINVQVPAGVPIGNSVPVIVSMTDPQTGVVTKSKMVTIAVQ
jgi:uncharacterized protein (TIGR03437 family)